MSPPQTESSPSTQRRWLRGLKRVLVGIGVGFLSLLVLGAVYEAIASARDESRFPAPGTRVEVGGYSLHLNCTGQGRPIVVLESGAGGMSTGWAWVQPELAKVTRVCSYDRAGHGWSDSGDGPADAETTVKQLHAALAGAGEIGPLVLVGHSLGGLFVRAYADRYPDEVAGLVLLDPSHPDQMERLPPVMREQFLLGQKVLAMAPALARVGLLRATGVFALQARGLPEQAYAQSASFMCTPKYFKATLDEMAAWEASAAQVRANTSLEDLPLLVVSAGTAPPSAVDFLAPFQALHEELTALSSRGEHHFIPEADHMSLLTNEQHARKTAAAILSLVEKVQAPRVSVPTGP
jgi:pimeloyl-ACP methyl ester carboxylesterase